jgi:hypothetical protein
MVFSDFFTITMPQCGVQNNPNGYREPGYPSDTRLFKSGQRIKTPLFAAACVEFPEGIEEIMTHQRSRTPFISRIGQRIHAQASPQAFSRQDRH